MDAPNIAKIIALITIFITLLLSFFLLTVKTKHQLSNRLLASFTILCSIDILGLFINQYQILFLCSKTFTLLIFPVFFLYVVSICRINFKLSFNSLLHAIPFIVYNLILILYFVTTSYASNDFIIETLKELTWIFNAALLKLQALLYIIATIYALRKHKKIYLDNYTGGDISVYKLLTQITFIFIITFPITVAKEIVPFTNFYDSLKWLNIALITLALLMLCWFILKALYNPELFRSVDFKIQTKNKITPKSNVIVESESDQKIIIEQLQQYMEEREPYLNPTLTLQELSSLLDMPSHKLSLIINKHIGLHFFDFVNQYRIAKAKNYLKDFSTNKMTIQQIFYDVGFNSKSSFNTAFKKHTGLTPTEFKNKFQ